MLYRSPDLMTGTQLPSSGLGHPVDQAYAPSLDIEGMIDKKLARRKEARYTVEDMDLGYSPDTFGGPHGVTQRPSSKAKAVYDKSPQVRDDCSVCGHYDCGCGGQQGTCTCTMDEGKSKVKFTTKTTPQTHPHIGWISPSGEDNVAPVGMNKHEDFARRLGFEGSNDLLGKGWIRYANTPKQLMLHYIKGDKNASVHAENYLKNNYWGQHITVDTAPPTIDYLGDYFDMYQGTELHQAIRHIRSRGEKVESMEPEEMIDAVVEGQNIEAVIRYSLQEVAPPGFEGTVKGMKKHSDISNPWALSWWMKGKGMKGTR